MRQPPLMQNGGLRDMLKITEIFKSIQGEGPYTGWPAIFIRLADCNMEPKCHFCDTDFSVKREMTEIQIAQVVRTLMEETHVQANGNPAPIIVISGGEPFNQDIRGLILELSFLSSIIQIETNGSIVPDHFSSYWGMVDIVISPKGLPVDDFMKKRAKAVKFVVREGTIPCKKWPVNTLKYVQPMDEKDPVKNKANLEWAVKLCVEQGYKLSVQLHKMIGVL